MKAIRPVFVTPIDEPTQDLNMGAGQAEYNTLPTTAIRRNGGHGDYFVTVSRWKLTDDERSSIYHGGADIVHQVIHTIGGVPADVYSGLRPRPEPRGSAMRKFFARRFLKKHHYCPKHLKRMKFSSVGGGIYSWYCCLDCEDEDRRKTQNRITECIALLGGAE